MRFSNTIGLYVVKCEVVFPTRALEPTGGPQNCSPPPVAAPLHHTRVQLLFKLFYKLRNRKHPQSTILQSQACIEGV